jgi:hypothetical protein
MPWRVEGRTGVHTEADIVDMLLPCKPVWPAGLSLSGEAVVVS